MVDFGETWRHLFVKFVLQVTVSEVTQACEDDQLCSGLKARIYGVVHGVQYIWEANLTKENGVIYLLTQITLLNNLVTILV